MSEENTRTMKSVQCSAVNPQPETNESNYRYIDRDTLLVSE